MAAAAAARLRPPHPRLADASFTSPPPPSPALSSAPVSFSCTLFPSAAAAPDGAPPSDERGDEPAERGDARGERGDSSP